MICAIKFTTEEMYLFYFTTNRQKRLSGTLTLYATVFCIVYQTLNFLRQYHQARWLASGFIGSLLRLRASHFFVLALPYSSNVYGVIVSDFLQAYMATTVVS